MSKPVIVIVPGAWHRPKHYQKLIDALAVIGYEAVGVTMPCVDSSPPLPSWDQDAAEVRRVIMEYLNAGRDVITIAHSFGGVAMSEAVKGLGRDDRNKQGSSSAVIRLVYMCAIMMPKDQNFFGQMAPATPEEEVAEAQRKSFNSQHAQMSTTEDGAMILDKDVVRGVFYDGCSPDEIEEALDLLGSYPSGPLSVPVTYSPFLEFPVTYIKCKNDRALPVSVQGRMIAQAGGVVDVEECEEGHSPFMSDTGFIVGCLRRAAGEV
ncbi:alpha/beta-hydrolase [Penicillium verhagenii]|uniref:alpha/beta-hydrolase n=1 Tax=Penicillium verhagenii TaxID=1562060 RepID=UPI00254518C3|nr:alpha/beta-hydrolase [Penicillium verhagenii]KAJ5939105.1 alpha/beta-hydrolase [Penicillium verhagenii]